MKKITRWWVARTSRDSLHNQLAKACKKVINENRLGNGTVTELTQLGYE